jgi:hypothetical protein
MTSLSELVSWAKDKVKEYPVHRQEIFSLVSLCESEIEEGGSVQHEIDLCKEDICQLIGIDNE